MHRIILITNLIRTIVLLNPTQLRPRLRYPTQLWFIVRQLVRSHNLLLLIRASVTTEGEKESAACENSTGCYTDADSCLGAGGES